MIIIGRYIIPIILFSLFSSNAKAQSYAELAGVASELEDKRQFQLAIDCRQKMIANDSFAEKRYFQYWHIAALYDSLGDREQSKVYRRLSVTDGNFDYFFNKRRFAIRLADDFITEKMYDSALCYLKYVQTLPMKSFICMRGSHHSTEFNYRVMLAFEGLNQIDSAINSFLPYAFEEWTDVSGVECSAEHLFEKDYHCQVLDFLRILRKRYGPLEVDEKIAGLAQTISVRREQQNGASGCTQYFFFDARFFGHEITLDSFGFSCNAHNANGACLSKDGDEIDFQKEQAIKKLSRTLIYLLGSPGNYL